MSQFRNYFHIVDLMVFFVQLFQKKYPLVVNR